MTATTVSLRALYRLVLRQLATRWRLAGLAALGSVAVLLALAARGADDPTRAATAVVANFGLGLVVPVCTLWVATAAFGDLVEDRLLAYVWLSPVPRWHLATAAYAASLTIVAPLVIVPLVVAALVSGVGSLPGATLGATALAVAAYAGVFLWAGLRFARGLWWGLLYVFVWENAVARIADGTARMAVRSYPASILHRATGVEVRLADRAAWASVVVPLVVALAGVALTSRRLDRLDVD